MNRNSESLAVWRARIDELILIERTKSAIGRAALSSLGQPFTLAWLEKQCPDTDRLRVAALLEQFLIRNGWVQTWGNTPHGRALYRMTQYGQQGFEAYQKGLEDILERGIDPVEEARLYMLKKGMVTEELDESDVQTKDPVVVPSGGQGGTPVVVAPPTPSGQDRAVAGSRAGKGEEDRGMDDMVRKEK